MEMWRSLFGCRTDAECMDKKINMTEFEVRANRRDTQEYVRRAKDIFFTGIFSAYLFLQAKKILKCFYIKLN